MPEKRESDMTDLQPHTPAPSQQHWLKRYYYLRAGFSLLWVAAAFVLAPHHVAVATALLIVYPLWDALANFLDARASGGMASNRTQAINVVISVATTLAVLVAMRTGGMHGMLGVYGAWAILSGLLQLGTALRRRKRYGAQWAMILSGAQSAAAGALFIQRSLLPAERGIADVAGYAAVGAIYFLISALWLTFARRQPEAVDAA